MDQVEFWNILLNFKEKSENQSGSLNDFSSLQCNLVARDFNFDKIFSVPKEVFIKKSYVSLLIFEFFRAAYPSVFNI